MSRILFVAKREFVTNIKRRGFLFTAFGIPVLIIAAQFAVAYFVQTQSEKTGGLGEIGYVDLTSDQVLATAENKPAEFRAFDQQDAAQAALIAGEIGAFFLIPPDYLTHGVVHAYAIRDIPRGIEEQLSSFLEDNLLADWPAQRANRLKHPGHLTFATLDNQKEVQSDESIVAAIVVPIIFAVLLMMSIFTTSGFMLQGVVEEKENRLVEILVTSITPAQILWGKILGLGALGLLQIGIWAAVGALLLTQGAGLWSGVGDITIARPLLAWGAIYLLLGYVLFGALLAGIGAAVTSMQEGQQIAGIFSIIAAVPLLLSVTFFRNANGLIPIALSLFPFTAPVAMVMRLPFASVPLWQLATSLLLLVLATILIVWIAAQVFRVGLLMYGKRLGLRPLWMALRQGLDVIPETSQG
jgi:ABC-2 type transport system permease protein